MANFFESKIECAQRGKLRKTYAPISKRLIWCGVEEFEAKIESALEMPVQMYRDLAAYSAGDYANLAKEGMASYVQVAKAMDDAHERKLALMEGLARDAIVRWLAVHGLASVAETREDVLTKFSPGAAPIPAVRDAAKRGIAAPHAAGASLSSLIARADASCVADPVTADAPTRGSAFCASATAASNLPISV